MNEIDLFLATNLPGATPDYLSGFEVGQIYQKMRDKALAIEGTFREENLDLIYLFARLLDYEPVKQKKSNDGWVYLKFGYEKKYQVGQ